MSNLIDYCTSNAMPLLAYKEFNRNTATGSIIKPLNKKGNKQ